jgi:N-methylhydantoinase B/oxoprolinase/acetone carboxylase alpha subunit
MTDMPVRPDGPATEFRAHETLVTEEYVASVSPLIPSLSAGAGLETLIVAAMQTVTSEQMRELQARMADLQAMVAAKQHMRQLLGQISSERAQLQDQRDAYSALVDEAQQALTAQLGAMDDLSETESLRLQMAMDRMSKMMTTLSNILKKMSDTASAITQNIK